MAPSALKRLNNLPLSGTKGGVDAYMVVRNEVDRLPFIFEYHRRLGVERFFVVDNDSSDGTVDYLLSQPDCLTYHTTSSFAAAGCGMDWINMMVEMHGQQRWCLFIDADELIVYPHCEFVSLPAFCNLLLESRFEGVSAIMVDMYGEHGLGDEPDASSSSLLEVCPFYDRDYVVRPKITRPLGRRFHAVEAIGGPRMRVFYPEFLQAGPWRLFRARAARSLRHSRLGHWLKLDRSGIGICPPDITKIPLIFARPGRSWVSNHRTTPLELAPVTTALLHFKLLGGFAERARIEAARGEHWGGGSEYARYHVLLQTNGNPDFHYDGTRRYRTSADLMRDGIIRTMPALEALAASVAPQLHIIGGGQQRTA